MASPDWALPVGAGTTGVTGSGATGSTTGLLEPFDEPLPLELPAPWEDDELLADGVGVGVAPVSADGARGVTPFAVSVESVVEIPSL